MSSVTVQELDELLVLLSAKGKEVDVKDAELTALNKEYNALLFRIANYMKELGREEYDHPIGKFLIETKWRVNMPQSAQDKQLLFEHLKEREIFDQYATVNANSLNALYREDWKAAEERGEGMMFTMPGVPAPKYDTVPKFKPKKVKSGVEG